VQVPPRDGQSRSYRILLYQPLLVRKQALRRPDSQLRTWKTFEGWLGSVFGAAIAVPARATRTAMLRNFMLTSFRDMRWSEWCNDFGLLTKEAGGTIVSLYIRRSRKGGERIKNENLMTDWIATRASKIQLGMPIWTCTAWFHLDTHTQFINARRLSRKGNYLRSTIHVPFRYSHPWNGLGQYTHDEFCSGPTVKALAQINHKAGRI
jgi:hypothetical protein